MTPFLQLLNGENIKPTPLMIKSKYGNKKTFVGSLRFDSKKEAKRWGELNLLQRAGEITNLERQVKYIFIHNGIGLGSYVADFRYSEKGKEVVEDVKGYKGGAAYATFRQKKKMMLAFFGIEVKET